jgi:hypothetical protein
MLSAVSVVPFLNRRLRHSSVSFYLSAPAMDISSVQYQVLGMNCILECFGSERTLCAHVTCCVCWINCVVWNRIHCTRRLVQQWHYSCDSVSVLLSSLLCFYSDLDCVLLPGGHSAPDITTINTALCYHSACVYLDLVFVLLPGGHSAPHTITIHRV